MNSTEPPISKESDLKRLIMAEIAVHVQVYGRSRWELIREKPEYAATIGEAAGPSGKRKFFRWVNAVCEPMAADTTRPHEGRDVTEAAMDEAAKRARVAAIKNIPAPPSPAYMLRAGVRAERNINFLDETVTLFADAERMREEAFDKETGEMINPKLFSESIKRRMEIMGLAISVRREVYDQRDMMEFYEMVAQILVEHLSPYPDLQLAIIQRIESFNNERGATPFARAS